MTTSLSSVELNYLVFRYLQESGFTHSAFALGYEAGINKCKIDGNLVPPGALITFVQKGLRYMEIEANLSNSEADVDEDFAFLEPLDLITKDVNELRKMKEEKKKDPRKCRDKEFDKENDGERKHARDRERHDGEKEQEIDREKIVKDKEKEKQHEEHADTVMVTDQDNNVDVKHEDNGISGGRT